MEVPGGGEDHRRVGGGDNISNDLSERERERERVRE